MEISKAQEDIPVVARPPAGDAPDLDLTDHVRASDALNGGDRSAENANHQAPAAPDSQAEVATADATAVPELSTTDPTGPPRELSPDPDIMPDPAPTSEVNAPTHPDDEEMVDADSAVVDADSTVVDAVPSSIKVAREREDDEEMEPLAKRARTETPAESLQPQDASQVSTPAVAPQTASTNGHSPLAPASAPTTAPSTAHLGSTSTTTNGQAPPSPPEADFGPITEMQTKMLSDGLRNIKKSKSAAAFAKPVDAIALHIPQYYDIIKNPVDLSTMEQRLKSGHYKSVNGYIADFDQMVRNSVTFNGPDHLVTQSARNIRQMLNAQLKRVPLAKSGNAPPVQAPAEVPKKQRKRSLSSAHEKPPKAPRTSLPSRPAPPTATAPEQTYALDNDGMPQIRRHSSITDGRPKREIHRPPPKDLPYTAKPKKKKYQVELRFCQETLDEITRPAYANTIAAPFLYPVDPVALNIPNYRSIVKKPMDLGTVRDKLNAGMYENAKEFEQDVKSIFSNCYKFNGKDHPVSKMGQDLERAFDDQWTKKNSWISNHALASAPQSPEADESESEEEEEEEEEDDEEVQRKAQLEAIHGQFAQLSAQLLALQSQPAPKKAKAPAPAAGKKSKSGKDKSRGKSSSIPGGAALPIRSDKKKSKPKEKKLKPITNAQKEEISEKIGLLTTEQMGRAAEIIKNSLRKAGRGDLADRADDEMEFEIDQIPDEALHELLKLVRKTAPVAGGSVKAEDTDYRPAPPTKGAPSANQGKVRKNKPMKGAEQEDQINRIKQQLDSFQNTAGLANSDGQSSCRDFLLFVVANMVSRCQRRSCHQQRR